MNKKKEVLNLEWDSKPSRDRVSATLVCNYLRLNGINVVEASVWNGLQTIYESKANLVFMTNTIGAKENLLAMKYAKKRGKLGMSLISEGNFQGDDEYQKEMIWGWNKNKILFEDIHMQWSERTRKLTLSIYPELEGKIKISGGVGFDNYQVSGKDNIKNRLLEKYGKNNYKKIIGVGCWDFGFFDREDTRYDTFKNLFDGVQKSRFLEDSVKFDKVLSEVVEANKDILFILKLHPGLQLGLKASGILNTSKLHNTLIIHNEEQIFECIQTSDIWIVYESTTALEAWLLKKMTCLINPSGRDFPRDKINEGSPAYATAKELQKFIENYYLGKKNIEFDQRKSSRDEIIKNIIQWDDGLNHVRAGNLILDMLEKKQTSYDVKEEIKENLMRIKQNIMWNISPILSRLGLKKYCVINKNDFDHKELSTFSQKKLIEQVKFYEEKKLSMVELRKIKYL